MFCLVVPEPISREMTSSSTCSDIVSLDDDNSFNISYLAEGAANVVFTICRKRDSRNKVDDFDQPAINTKNAILGIDPRLNDKLLRLRKDLPSTSLVMESHQHFVEQIKPLFPTESLVEQMLCKITPKFVRKCNRELQELEGHGVRPEKRRGVYLAENEPYAIAITDMRWDKQHASCEFKPKWLGQSPTAPPGSKRCRTCALQAMRSAKDARPPGLTDFCPLTLVSDDQDLMASSLERALGHSRGSPLDIHGFVQQLRPYFQKTSLLRRLRDLQIQMDPRGILKSDPSSITFVTAMTLRDCTLFLKVSMRLMSALGQRPDISRYPTRIMEKHA